MRRVFYYMLVFALLFSGACSVADVEPAPAVEAPAFTLDSDEQPADVYVPPDDMSSSPTDAPEPPVDVSALPEVEPEPPDFPPDIFPVVTRDLIGENALKL